MSQSKRIKGRPGTLAEKIFAELKDGWRSDEEIAAAAGVSLRQARASLYRAAALGRIQYRRKIEYRTQPKKGGR